MRPLATLLACLALAGLAVAAEGGAARSPAAGSYIVVFKSNAVQGPTVATTARQLASAHTGRISFVYSHALEGFAVRMTPTGAAAVARDARVAYVEPDQVMHAFASQTPATWGLDRIDQRDLPLNNTYTYNQTGAGVNAYIIDTGMRATHQEFSGRVGNGADFVGDGNGTNDCNGHGTHVAGTTGGTTYGVAKQVTLHAVRVLNCQGSGTNSGVIAGVDWVTANHVGASVANMSLGGGVSSALDSAVNNSINSGVSYAIAAGNSNTNACNDVAGARRGRQHHRRDDEHGRPRVVLELRDVPGSLRAGQRDHLVLEHERHRDEHDQRDLDGDATRDRGDRALPADEPGRLARNRHAGADLELDAEPRHERRQRVAEPAPVLDLRRAAATATAATSARSSSAATSTADRTDRQRRLRRLGLTVGALRERVLVDRRLPALGHRLLDPRRGQQRERERVPDGEHPVDRGGHVHVLAQHHDERGVLHRVRLHVRRGAEHVGRAALDARHVDERELRNRGRLLAEVVQPRCVERSDGARAVPRDDRLQPPDQLPDRRRLTEVGHFEGWAAPAPSTLRSSPSAGRRPA